MAPSHVLVPFDGSPLAEKALRQAVEIFDCRVTVLNVVTPVDAGMSEGGILDPGDERRKAARERADDMVELARTQACEDDRTIEKAVETGDPSEIVLEYAGDHDVDHIVMGGHGGERSEIARRLLGTVATNVVGEAPVTVTVVR
jgi:nucleotide-binding universal stress UspA family protein